MRKQQIFNKLHILQMKISISHVNLLQIAIIIIIENDNAKDNNDDNIDNIEKDNDSIINI